MLAGITILPLSSRIAEKIIELGLDKSFFDFQVKSSTHFLHQELVSRKGI